MNNFSDLRFLTNIILISINNIQDKFFNFDAEYFFFFEKFKSRIKFL